MSSIEGSLEGRIGSIESWLHSDMVQVTGKLMELKVRVARLEEKQTR